MGNQCCFTISTTEVDTAQASDSNVEAAIPVPKVAADKIRRTHRSRTKREAQTLAARKLYLLVSVEKFNSRISDADVAAFRSLSSGNTELHPHFLKGLGLGLVGNVNVNPQSGGLQSQKNLQ